MASAAAYPVRSPQWVLTYQGVNITAEVSRMVTGITYTDFLGGLSGEVELEIEDREKRWQGPWYPALGDRLNLMIGYEGEALMPGGDFEVDELEFSAPPDVLRMRCLAAWITPALRTPNTAAWENQTLLGIAASIAGRYGLTLVGAAGASNLKFARLTQRQETDLGFLHRIAREHNYDFTVRGDQLVFYARGELEQGAAVGTLARSDLLRLRLSSRTHRTYRSAVVAWQDAAHKQLVVHSAEASAPVAAGDQLKLSARSENAQQAALRAASALHEANMRMVEATLEMPGMTLAAGSNVMLAGCGEFDGKYLIECARHRLTRAAGYLTRLEVRRVQ